MTTLQYDISYDCITVYQLWLYYHMTALQHDISNYDSITIWYQ